MSTLINLQQTPNQTLTSTLEGFRYEMTIKSARGIMAVDITRNNIRLLTGIRAVFGTPLMPYQYIATGGNFMFNTENDQLPDWRLFGNTQNLIYLTRSEVEAFINA